jgi:two-component system, sporulation sensor kinase E
LRGIQSLVSWIEEDDMAGISENSKKYFSKIKNRVNRLDKLITGILSYSKLKILDEKKEEINTIFIIDEIKDQLIFSEKISLRADSNLPTIFGNCNQVKQVFSNLVSNGIKYNDKDEIEINIGCDFDPLSKVYIFKIRDNGPGIEKVFHEKIFSMFQTLHSKDEIDSTGIGLTIVKKIIDINAEKIWLESEKDKGTTFYFTWKKESVTRV